MYVIVYSSNNDLVFRSEPNVERGLEPNAIYSEFNPESMKMGWCETAEIPEHFEIDENGLVVELSLEEQHVQGLIELDPNEKIVDNRIVEKSMQEQMDEGLVALNPDEKLENDEIVVKSLEEQAAEGLIEINAPFEYIEDNQIKKRTIEEVIEQDLLQSKDDCERALRYISATIEEKIAEQYSPGYELKITKDYMVWIDEGKPGNDVRKQKFDEMTAYISGVKEHYKAPKETVRTLLANFSD